MSVKNKTLNSWTMSAGENLDDLTKGTGEIWKAINLTDGKISASPFTAGGLLTYGGKAGEHVTFDISGILKFTAGAAVAVGKRLTVTTSGYLITAGSGDYSVGRNLTPAVGSGAIGTGVFDFSAPKYLVNCLAAL